VEAFKKACPDFRADAQLGAELSRHSAIREGGNAGALDEEGHRFRDLWDEAFCAEVKSRSGRGEERAQRKLEQRSGGGSHQSAEDAQAPDVWSSRLRTLTSPIAADVSWLPAAPKVTKNQIKDKSPWKSHHVLNKERRQARYGIEMIAPYRGVRRTPTHDGRPLRRDRRRWRVERFFAWLLC